MRLRRLFPVLFGASGTGASINLTSGLLAYWSIDAESDGSAPATRQDAWGTAHLIDHGTTASAAGVRGNAAHLAAADKTYFSAFNSTPFAVGNNDFEMVFWVKINADTQARLISKDNLGSTREYAVAYAAGSRLLGWFAWCGGVFKSVATDAALTLGEWYMVDVYFDKARQKLGIALNNGAFKEVDTGSSTLDAKTAAFEIGRLQGNDSEYADADLDEVGVWKGRLLNAAERTKLYEDKGIAEVIPAVAFAASAQKDILPGCTCTLRVSDAAACDDPDNWNAATKVYSYTPTSAEAPSIKRVNFTNASAETMALEMVVWRNWPYIARYAGNPIVSPGAHDYDAFGVDAMYFRAADKIGDTYYALSQVSDVFNHWFALALYTSTDRRAWTAHAQNPALEEDAIESYLLHPSIIKVGETYRAYYSAVYAATNRQQIFMATSPDLVTWTKYDTEPVFVNPNANETSCPNVIKIGSLYYLYYWAKSTWSGNICYATSEDGLAWTDHGVALRRVAGEWDDGKSNLDPWVTQNAGGLYEMTYTALTVGGGRQVSGVAISDDGVNWRKYPGAILEPSASDWDNGILGNPVLYFEGTDALVYYYGEGYPSQTGQSGLAILSA